MIYIIDSDIPAFDIVDKSVNIEEDYCFKDSFYCAFRSLSQSEQQVITLLCQGYSYNEMIDLLGVSYDTVRQRVSRAKRAFKKSLSEYGISVK